MFVFVADGTGISRTLLESIDLGVVSEEDGTLTHSTMALVPSKTRREKGTAKTHGLTENFIRKRQARLRCRRAATEILEPEKETKVNDKRTRRQRGAKYIFRTPIISFFNSLRTQLIFNFSAVQFNMM